MLKRWVALMLIVCVMAGFPAFSAANAPQANEKVIQCLALPEALKGDMQSVVARDLNTGKVIAMSGSDGEFVYALAEPGTEIEAACVREMLFSDLDPVYGDYFASFVSRRGIMVGDQDNYFHGDKPLTRAEMAVILTRLLDFRGESKHEFSDVPSQAWFAPYISALTQAGVLAQGDSFFPQREVTKQELCTMAARALDAMALDKTPTDPEYAQQRIETALDWGDVAQYAKPYYKMLSQNGIPVLEEWVDNDMVDLNDDEIYLHPADTVTRFEAAQFISSYLNIVIRNHAPAMPTTLAASYGLDTQMPVIDGSTSSYPITTALYYSLFYNAANHPSFPNTHTKTITSYERLINGEADIILVPDPNSDVKALAASKGVSLKYIPIANEALVFFTGKENPVENLTSGQIKDIYIDNAFQNWNELGGPDAPFSAFCRNNDSGSHAQMEKFFLEGKEINENIRRERTSVLMASILTDVQDFERENPGAFALGYSMFYYFHTAGSVVGNENLKLLSVDGVAPTEASLKDGSYPLTTNYFAVVREDEPSDSPAMRLAALLTGKDGQLCIENAGFGSLK